MLGLLLLDFCVILCFLIPLLASLARLGALLDPPSCQHSWPSFSSILALSMLLSSRTWCIIFPDRQRVGVGVTGMPCVSTSWEATLPTYVSMAVYRCQVGGSLSVD